MEYVDLVKNPPEDLEVIPFMELYGIHMKLKLAVRSHLSKRLDLTNRNIAFNKEWRKESKRYLTYDLKEECRRKLYRKYNFDVDYKRDSKLLDRKINDLITSNHVVESVFERRKPQS
jgi:hypothetical protein